MSAQSITHADVAQVASPAGGWAQTLTRDPEVLHRLLADLWQAVSANRESPGRARQPTIDDVFGILAPDFSTDSFAQAVHVKLEGRSIRWLSRRIYVHHSLVHRWTTGESPIVNLADPTASMERIEAIAAALGTHPAYFSEWRRLWVLVLVDDAFETHPNLSIGVWRKFSHAARRP